MKNLKLKLAELTDLKTLCSFTDFWLAGRGKRVNAPGAVDDCFISPSQHKKYIHKYITILAYRKDQLVGWAVIQYDNSLIHLLISGYYRHQGIGTQILEHIKPQFIRSKSNQSSGNPKTFYEKNGYKLIKTIQSKSRLDIDKIRPNRKKIIDVFQKVNFGHTLPLNKNLRTLKLKPGPRNWANN